jgi:hypothetical protein
MQLWEDVNHSVAPGKAAEVSEQLKNRNAIGVSYSVLYFITMVLPCHSLKQ